MQQKAASLESEVAERKEAEGRLQASETRYRRLLETASDGIVILDPETRKVIDVNTSMTSLLGLAREEILGKEIWETGLFEDRSAAQEVLRELDEAHFSRREQSIPGAGGGQRLELEIVSSLYRVNGRQVIQCNVRGIAERKLVEARLREQAELIETIYRTGQALSAELNLQKVVQVVTDAATELIGARFGSFLYNVTDQDGESYLLYPLSGAPRDTVAHLPMPRKTDLFGPTFGGEQIIRIADVKKDPRYGKNSPYYGMPAGHLPVTSYLAAPVVSRSGEVLGGLFFGHPDEGVFTERHERIIEGLAAQAAIAMDNARLYEQSQRERAKAEAANRMKDEFLATVSHELRTPLNAIIGWSHMLRKSRLDEAMVARAVETIERNAKAQAQLIEDILDVSRVITGKLLLNIGPVDMASVINAAIDSVQLAADSKGIKLGMIIDPSARHVKGDSNRLQQVVWNLLSNAIRSAEGLWTREGETSHRQTLPSIEGVQVLLVDDDRDGLQVITAILSEYGAVLQTASSAAEALEILQWHRPDVLVSDLAMPDEDGYSLIRKIREQEAETSEIPAVALTALVRVEDRARVLAEGFNRFVPKPVELILAIAGLAEHSVLR